MKKLLLTLSLLSITWITQADLGLPNQMLANPPRPVVDFSKPMLLNFSSLPVTVYYYSASVNKNTTPASIDDNSCLNPNDLGFVILPGGGINFTMTGMSGQVRSVRIYFGPNDPITTDITNITKSWKIVPSADHWSITQLP